MKLSKGMTLNNGCIRIRVFSRGLLVCDETLGPATPESISAAEIYLARIRQNIRAERLGLPAVDVEMKFRDAAKLYIKKWGEATDANGRIVHSTESLDKLRGVIEREFIPVFGNYWFDAIKPKHVQAWRDKLVARGVSGTSANRYQAVLGSIFTHIDQWSKLETITPVRRPSGSPVASVDTAETIKRERILTQYEFRKLLLAAETLGDHDGKQIIKYLFITQLNEKDLKSLRLGAPIVMLRSKTKQRIELPMTMMHQLNWINWLKRWQAIRTEAGLEDVQVRDIRKTSINVVSGEYDEVLVSQYAAHASTKTTRENYIVNNAEKLRPIAKKLTDWASD